MLTLLLWNFLKQILCPKEKQTGKCTHSRTRTKENSYAEFKENESEMNVGIDDFILTLQMVILYQHGSQDEVTELVSHKQNFRVTGTHCSRPGDLD